MPLEYHFTGVSICLDAGERNDLVEFAGDLLPAHAENCAVEVDILPPGQLAAEARSHLEQRTDASRYVDVPADGSVTREMTLRSVDFPPRPVR